MANVLSVLTNEGRLNFLLNESTLRKNNAQAKNLMIFVGKVTGTYNITFIFIVNTIVCINHIKLSSI